MTLLSQPKIAKNGLYSGVAVYQIRWAHTRLILEMASTTMREEGDNVKPLDFEQFQQGNIFSGFHTEFCSTSRQCFQSYS